MAKRQVLKNQITWKGNSYEIVYRVEVDGMEKEIGKFQSKRLADIVACRELVANLPNLQTKLNAIVDLEDWFNGQLQKLEQRIKAPKTTKTAKKSKDEDKEAVLRNFLEKLGK